MWPRCCCSALSFGSKVSQECGNGRRRCSETQSQKQMSLWPYYIYTLRRRQLLLLRYWSKILTDSYGFIVAVVIGVAGFSFSWLQCHWVTDSGRGAVGSVPFMGAIAITRARAAQPLPLLVVKASTWKLKAFGNILGFLRAQSMGGIMS